MVPRYWATQHHTPEQISLQFQPQFFLFKVSLQFLDLVSSTSCYQSPFTISFSEEQTGWFIKQCNTLRNKYGRKLVLRHRLHNLHLKWMEIWHPIPEEVKKSIQYFPLHFLNAETHLIPPSLMLTINSNYLKLTPNTFYCPNIGTIDDTILLPLVMHKEKFYVLLTM